MFRPVSSHSLLCVCVCEFSLQLAYMETYSTIVSIKRIFSSSAWLSTFFVPSSSSRCCPLLVRTSQHQHNIALNVDWLNALSFIIFAKFHQSTQPHTLATHSRCLYLININISVASVAQYALSPMFWHFFELPDTWQCLPHITHRWTYGCIYGTVQLNVHSL